MATGTKILHRLKHIPLAYCHFRFHVKPENAEIQYKPRVNSLRNYFPFYFALWIILPPWTFGWFTFSKSTRNVLLFIFYYLFILSNFWYQMIRTLSRGSVMVYTFFPNFPDKPRYDMTQVLHQILACTREYAWFANTYAKRRKGKSLPRITQQKSGFSLRSD